MTRRKSLLIGLGAAAALGLLAAIFLVLSAQTPTYSNAAAYLADRNRIAADTLDQLSDQFFALQKRYATHKWLFADIGYAFSAWAGVALALTLLAWRTGWGRLVRSVRHPATLAALLVLALLAYFAGMAAVPVHSVRRGQIPPWMDGFTMPILNAMTAMLIIAPIAAALILAPLFRRAQSDLSLLGPSPKGRPISWTIVTLVYLGPIGLFALITALPFDTGAWAGSPGAAVLLWLMLNARALWLAPKRPAQVIDKAKVRTRT